MIVSSKIQDDVVLGEVRTKQNLFPTASPKRLHIPNVKINIQIYTRFSHKSKHRISPIDIRIKPIQIHIQQTLEKALILGIECKP